MSDLVFFLAVSDYSIDVGIYIRAFCVYYLESLHKDHVTGLCIIKSIAVGFSLPDLCQFGITKDCLLEFFCLCC